MTETAPLPDHPPELPAWLQAFEHAQAIITAVLLGLAEVEEPEIDLQPLADLLSSSLGAIFSAFDLRGDRLSQIREAVAAVGRVEQPLASQTADPLMADFGRKLASAREMLMAAERHFSNLPGALPPEPRLLRASTEVLSLHSIERASLLPRVRMPAPPPPPPLQLPPLEKPKTTADLADVVAKMRERAEQRRAARKQASEGAAPQLPSASPARPEPVVQPGPVPPAPVGQPAPVPSAQPEPGAQPVQPEPVGQPAALPFAKPAPPAAVPPAQVPSAHPAQPEPAGQPAVLPFAKPAPPAAVPSAQVPPAQVPPAQIPSAQPAQPESAASMPEQLPEGFIGPIEPALDEAGVAYRRTRDMFEEVAMVGAQRTPQLGDEWRNIRFLEKRMYAAIDAVASMGAPALAAVEELVVDSPVKDPTRGFAAIMLLGSCEGRDALAAAERVVQYLGADDPEVSAYASQALKLVPHPHLALAMRRLLASSRPRERAMALDVLVHRGVVSIEELVRYAHDEAPEVVSVALLALALHAPYHNQLGQLLMSAAARPGAQPAAWLGMALSSHPNAKYEPAKALDGPDAEQAALALALVADNYVAESLIERCRSEPRAGLVTAVGWAGAAGEALPVLIDLLAHEDEQLVVAAGYALDRLTGAQLFEEVQVDPEQIIVPDVPVPEVAELEAQDAPLARQVSDPRDLPGEGSPDTVVRPSTSQEAWRAYYSEQRSRYQLGARYRYGHPYSPKVSLWGLDGWPLTAPERRFLYYELVVRTGFFIRFDPLDFVYVQQQALKDWEATIEKVQSTAGTWSRPSRRR